MNITANITTYSKADCWVELRNTKTFAKEVSKLNASNDPYMSKGDVDCFAVDEVLKTLLIEKLNPLKSLSMKQLNDRLEENEVEYQACLAGMSHACDAELLGKIDNIREELDYRKFGYPTL